MTTAEIGNWLINNFGAEWLILGYLFYEFRFGFVRHIYDSVRSFVPPLVILAQEVESVDEEKVIETLPNELNTPSVFLSRGDSETDLTDEQKKEIEKIVGE